MVKEPLKIAIKGSTQDHLPIEDVVDDIVILKDGSCSMVMQISSVNFDLLSEREQSALIFAYGGILNSLNFPIQIMISSHTKDVSSYLNNLKELSSKQANTLLQERINLYRKFIEETVKKNAVLSKTFYILVHFSILELGIKAIPWIKKQGKTSELPFPREYVLEKAKASLEPKRDHLMRLFSRLGLEIEPLNTRELVELFYKAYNGGMTSSQKLEELNLE